MDQNIKISREVNEILKYHHFPEFHEVLGRKSIIHLFSSNDSCGIYILKFINNEYYVGQSINISMRFIQHSKTHKDIEAISFVLVKKEGLNELEQELIAKFDLNKIYIRNIALAAIPKGIGELDLLWGNKEQEKWLSNSNQVPLIKDRVIDENQQRKYHNKFIKLKDDVNYSEVREFLKMYFEYCIPELTLTEFDFWRISCLPMEVAEEKTYCRINIYKQEVLTIGYHKKEKLIGFSFHVSRISLKENRFLDQFEEGEYDFKLENGKTLTIGLVNHYYKTGGADQINIYVNSQYEAIRLINDPIFQQAVKDFNLRLMKMGVGFNKNSHCFDLVTDVIS